MDKVGFQEGVWEAIQVVSVAALVLCLIIWLSDQKTRQQGLWLLGIVLVSGLIGGLLKGLGIRIVTGG